MKERVSALLDDALDEEASSRLFESIKRDAGLRRDWESYCLIGDVLREDTPLSTDFTSKVMANLSDEVTVLAPVRRESAGWAHKLMPIAASVMGVAAVAWVAMTLNGPGAEVQRLARSLTQITSDARTQRVLSIASMMVEHIEDLGPVHERHVRINGNVAVVSVRMQLTGKYHDVETHGDFRFTRVWTQDAAGALQVTAAHSGVVA